MFPIFQKTIDIVKEFEGFSSVPYKCPAGELTIGYGHVVRRDEKFKKIDEKQAEEILKKDLQYAASILYENFNVENLTNNQISALVSFIYNVGSTAFLKSTMAKYLKTGDIEKVSREFSRWIFINKSVSNGLMSRRGAEILLFNEPDQPITIIRRE